MACEEGQAEWEVDVPACREGHDSSSRPLDWQRQSNDQDLTAVKTEAALVRRRDAVHVGPLGFVDTSRELSPAECGPRPLQRGP